MLWRRIVLFFLVFLNLFLFFRLIWSDQGVFAYIDLKHRYRKLKQQLEEVDEKSRNVSREIRRLKSDKSYQEKVVRERMNFVKENEVLYVFPESGDRPRGVGADATKN
jgi:cell division protein FtsB